VDVHRFERLAGQGSVAELEEAASLFRGELLDGFDLDSEVTAGFDEWLTAERARLRDVAVGALARLADHHARAGRMSAAAETAQSVLRLDPVHEGGHRILMTVYAQSGRRTAALQQFKVLSERLRDELQTEPEPETHRLHEAIRRAAESAPAAIGNESAVPHDNPTVATRDHDEVDARKRPAAFLPGPLRWAIAGAGVVLVGAAVTLGTIFWRIPELAPAPLGAYIAAVKRTVHHVVPNGERPSIAVLPFRSQGGDAAVQFAEAVGESITTALSMASDMVVVARSSALAYEDKQTPAEEMAAELGVRYLLEGSVQKWDDSAVVHVALVDTDGAAHRVWSKAFEDKLENFRPLQQRITIEVLTSLEVSLTEGEQERVDRSHGTDNLEAWLETAQAERYLRRLTPSDNIQARALYEKARDLDPNYPGPADGLAWTYFLDARFGWSKSPADSIAKAMELAGEVLALDPERARTYSLLGAVELFAGNYNRAVDLGEKAVELGPNDADAAALLAYTLTFTGEPRRAIALVERAVTLRPFPPDWYRWLLARAHRLSGNPRKTVDILEPESGLTGGSYIPLVELAAAYEDLGALAKARAAAASVTSAYPRFSVRAWVAVPAFKDPDTTEDEVTSLLRAGLPE
jgi:TolB-like protein/Flp pilus assembly protein TadD